MSINRVFPAIAHNVLGLGEGGELELQMFKISTNDR